MPHCIWPETIGKTGLNEYRSYAMNHFLNLPFGNTIGFGLTWNRCVVAYVKLRKCSLESWAFISLNVFYLLSWPNRLQEPVIDVVNTLRSDGVTVYPSRSSVIDQ